MFQSSNAPEENIGAFIALFDGDPIQAVRAISDYAKKNTSNAVKPPHLPYGSVLVNLKGVKKLYKVGHQYISALNGVSFQIRQGEFVALTGASGSGKSTLLQLIGGLDNPTEGIVEVNEINLRKLTDSKLSKFRNQTIGFVFQFFYLQPFLKVGTNLEVPAMFAHIKSKDRHKIANRLAKAVGIDDRMNHLPRELSGGQMQRAAIARALLNNPKLLLADEPTGNLDSSNSAAVIALFEAIRKEFGTTIVVVTHDANIAARADREIRLKDGLIV